MDLCLTPVSPCIPLTSSLSPWQPAPQLPPGRWRGRIQTAVDHSPLPSPLALGTMRGEGTDGQPPHPPQAICYPAHPKDLGAWQGRGSNGLEQRDGPPAATISPIQASSEPNLVSRRPGRERTHGDQEYREKKIHVSENIEY